MNVLWSIPDQPNGVITNYSLLINNGTGYRLKCQGIELSCGVSGLTPGRSYQFYVVANTSAGGTRSTEVTVEMPLPMQRPGKRGEHSYFARHALCVLSLIECLKSVPNCSFNQCRIECLIDLLIKAMYTETSFL